HKKLLLAAQQDKRLGVGFNFNLLTAVSWGTVLYFGQLGTSRSLMLRQNKLYDIDEGEHKSGQLYLASGLMQAGDRFLLATNELVQNLKKEEMIRQLSLPPQEIAASIERQ